ncbi:MAG TPA: tetratricopeptide repeat protein, partial [Candidatus Xenobia bacterium]
MIPLRQAGVLVGTNGPDMIRRMEIDLTGWVLVQENPRLFSNERGDALLLQYIADPPVLPAPLTDVDDWREWEKAVAAQEGGHLVAVDAVLCDGLPTMSVLLEYPREATFIGMLISPREQACYIAKVVCADGEQAADLLQWLRTSLKFSEDVYQERPFRAPAPTRGAAWHSAQQWARALAPLAEALEADPHDHRSRYRRAQCAMALGDAVTVLEDVAILLRVADGVPLRLMQIRACLMTHQPEAALEAADRGVSAAPADFELRRLRGVVLRALGRFEPALSDFDAALQLMSGDADARLGRATCLVALQRSEEALHDFHRAMRDAPDREDVWLTAADTLAEMGQADQALAQLEDLVRRHPHCLEGWEQMVRLLRHLGRLTEAAERLKSAPDTLTN